MTAVARLDLADSQQRPSSVIEDEASVTSAVLAAMANAPNPRLRQIAEAFVRHMHAFVREVRLTEEEFELAIDFLNRIGQATNDRHNEGILFSDAIGVSTLVCLLNNGQNGATETASALLGPFWRMNSPRTENGGTIVRSPTPGPEIFVNCWIKDPSGKPIADAEIDVWHSSTEGFYEQQDPKQAPMNLRGKFRTDKDGRFWFRSIKPAGYPIPIDGPVGDLIRAGKRHNFRPAHLHFLIFKEGFKTLVSQIYSPDDDKLETDVQFGVTRALIGDYRKHAAGEKAPAADVKGEWYSLDQTFVMEPGKAKLPKPPIQ